MSLISTEIANEEKYCKLVTTRGYQGSTNLSTTVIASDHKDVPPKVWGIVTYNPSLGKDEIYQIHSFIADEVDKKLETMQMISGIVGDLAFYSSEKFIYHDGY